MKILLVHPGASYATADVFTGLKAGLQTLAAQGADITLSQITFDLRMARHDQFFQWMWKKDSKTADGAVERPTPVDAQYAASCDVVIRALRFEPDWIIICSGMFFHMEALNHLRRIGIPIGLLMTECPYDDAAHERFAAGCDLAWANDKVSVERIGKVCPTRYLGAGFNPLVHRPDWPAAEVGHDVVFVSTSFKERRDFMKKVRFGNLDFGLYGDWSRRGALGQYVRDGITENTAAAALYRASKICLNMHRDSTFLRGEGTSASYGTPWSANPRAIELAALGCFQLCDPRPEVVEMFGDAVGLYDSPSALSDALRFYMDNPALRAEMAEASRVRVQGRSWSKLSEVVYGDLCDPTRVTAT